MEALNKIKQVMCKIDWSLVIQGLSALGAIAVAIVAVWGEWIKSIVVPPKLKIELHNTKGQPGKTGQTSVQAYFYHLKVVNRRRWSPARNCRVMLSDYYKLLPNGQWERYEMTVEPAFRWAPADQTQKYETVHSQLVFDFVRVIKGNNFEPCLNRSFSDFTGYVLQDKSVRYGIRVVSDESEQIKPQVFQVDWNGIWPGDEGSIVTIAEVPA